MSCSFFMPVGFAGILRQMHKRQIMITDKRPSVFSKERFSDENRTQTDLWITTNYVLQSEANNITFKLLKFSFISLHFSVFITITQKVADGTRWIQCFLSEERISTTKKKFKLVESFSCSTPEKPKVFRNAPPRKTFEVQTIQQRSVGSRIFARIGT